MRKRPTGVLIVGLFGLVGAVIAIVVGISLLWPGTPLDAIWNLNRKAYTQFKFLGRIAGLLLLVVAIVTASTGVGILKGRKWGWWLAVGTFATNGAGDLVNIFIGEPLKGTAGLVIAGGFLIYLLRPATRRFFEGAQPARDAASIN